jgi:hypothetical protein
MPRELGAALAKGNPEAAGAGAEPADVHRGMVRDGRLPATTARPRPDMDNSL